MSVSFKFACNTLMFSFYQAALQHTSTAISCKPAVSSSFAGVELGVAQP